jgi:hypothetical protein
MVGAIDSSCFTYPGSADQGWILYIKPGYHGNEPVHIQDYAKAYKTFPMSPRPISFSPNLSWKRIGDWVPTSSS